MQNPKKILTNGIVKVVRSCDAVIRRRTDTVLAIETVVVLFMVLFVITPLAHADDGESLKSAFDTSSAFGALQTLVTTLFLPLGIAWASWQIVYIAVVCGLIGIDPLNLIGGNVDQDHVWAEVRKRFRNFGYGIAWVAGIWLLFEFVLFVVTKFANIIGNAF